MQVGLLIRMGLGWMVEITYTLFAFNSRIWGDDWDFKAPWGKVALIPWFDSANVSDIPESYGGDPNTKNVNTKCFEKWWRIPAEWFPVSMADKLEGA